MVIHLYLQITVTWSKINIFERFKKQINRAKSAVRFVIEAYKIINVGPSTLVL